MAPTKAMTWVRVSSQFKCRVLAGDVAIDQILLREHLHRHRQSHRRYGHLDILINNATIMAGEGGSTTQPDDWRRVFETNVIGTVAVTNAFLPLLQKSSDAKIVVISSSMGSISIAETSAPHPLVTIASPYKASKAAMNMIRVEWSRMLKGIRVWGVDPGLCATELAGEYSMSNGQDPKEGADIARQCIEGETDECTGKVM